MTKVLVITYTDDPHIPFLQRHLDEEMVIFDPALFPLGTNITYSLNGTTFDILSEGVCFNTFDAVWYRKPIYLIPEDFNVPTEYQLFAHKSYEETVKAMYDLLRNKLWVSDVRSIKKASNKLYQLEVASELGFKVPNTIVTSNPIHAQEFRSRHERIITKSLVFQPVQKEDGDTYIFYTTRIPPEIEVDFTGLCVAPAMFQTEVAKVSDIRVTVVGHEVFPCRISSIGNLAHEVDWRVGILGNELRYEFAQDFPQQLSDKCIQLVKVLGLQFGAIDFVQDVNGEYWFLEINPNGQWGFIEEETSLPISDSFANLLRKGLTS